MEPSSVSTPLRRGGDPKLEVEPPHASTYAAPMQESLFDTELPPASATALSIVSATAAPPTRNGIPGASAPTPADPRPVARRTGVQAVAPSPDLVELARALPRLLRLGGSTWSYPGWAGLVWDRPYSESLLARRGLPAYARHPLMRCVCVDRSFYRPLSAAQYEGLAQQVGDDFRFIVKGPALVCDAQTRDENGRGRQTNPAFLDPALSVQEFVQPALEGLGAKLGALVFQLSPLPPGWLADMRPTLDRLDRLLASLPPLKDHSPDGVIAIEVRDPQWLTEGFVEVLKHHGASYCLGLHPKLPPIDEQLWLLRRLWPSPLVCRWNLHRRHGPFGYEEAEQRYGDYSRLVDPDEATRETLARVARATALAGLPAYIGISNHAEGCAPLSAQALAERIRALGGGASPPPVRRAEEGTGDGMGVGMAQAAVAAPQD